MKKSDLKTGMRVETNEGIIYIVLNGTGTINPFNDGLIFANNKYYLFGRFYDEDMIRTVNDASSEHTIYRVYAHDSADGILDTTQKGELIWQREEAK